MVPREVKELGVWSERLLGAYVVVFLGPEGCAAPSGHWPLGVPLKVLSLWMSVSLEHLVDCFRY